MKFRIIKLVGIFLMFNLMINGASGQEYIDDDELFYSQKLKAGMEFTWEFVRFNFEFNNTNIDSPVLNQASTITTPAETVTVTVSTTSDTVIVTETVTPDPVTVTETSSVSDPEFPVIPHGSKYTLKLLKDLGDLSQREYWDIYGSDSNEYYDGGFSDPNLNAVELFGVFDLFITPSEINFSNGTELNYFEYSVGERQRQMEENSDEFTDEDPEGSEEYFIQDGVAIRKIDFSFENEKLVAEERIDIDTGVLLYLAVIQEFEDMKVDALIVLDQTKGIDINTVIDNNDPTLSVPLSAIFVYPLILVPIIANRIRKK